MNEIVLDASVILRWAFEDEADREGALVVARRLADGTLQAVAPPTFLPEVAGVLVRTVRAGRIGRDVADAVMAALVKVSIDEGDPHGLAMGAMRHAFEHGIHVQDATYIETSRRRGIPLVSADATQLRAASAAGVVATAVGEVLDRNT